MTVKEYIDAFVKLSDEHAEAVEQLKKAVEELIEQHTPADPLIKDEKVRKAVRAWADALKLVNCRYDAYWKAFRFCDLTISFLCDFDLEDGRIYDITELCGEDDDD